MTDVYKEFSFTEVREHSLLYYLPIVGFIPFPSACEMQRADFRIWTRVAESTSNDEKCHVKGAFYLD